MNLIRLISFIILFSYALAVISPAAAETPPVVPPPAGSGPNMRTAHKWLGYSALALGAVAAFSSSSEDLHCGAAWGAAILGTAALTTGVVKYRRTVDLSDGISRFDGHAILGGLAAVGFITACVLAGTGGEDDDDEYEGEDDDDVNAAHAAIGGVALATMAVSVVVIKVKW
jgi:hypothetical protein